MYGYWTHMTDQGRAGGALLGKVVVEGEMLPWDPILVTVNCLSNTVFTTQTDPKGSFVINPANVPGELSQQGDRQRQMQVHYEGCVVEAFLTGFRSTKLAITERHLRDDPSIGTVTLSRDSNARATAMSATSQTAPPAAAKLWSKAGAEMLAGKPDRAREDLEKAVRAYPAFADAWYQLGRMQMLSSPRDARACFEKAIAADPKFLPPFEQLAALAAQQEDWQGVVSNTNRSLELNPDGGMRIWYFDALANFQLGKIDAAEGSAKRLMVADPLHNIRNGEQLYAAILARKADYAGALAHLRNCLTYIPDGPDANLLKQQIAQLQRHVSPAN
jgi:tetratricopeptide (TPR) repeat protein